MQAVGGRFLLHRVLERPSGRRNDSATVEIP
jgi:hypothetical protein